MKFSRRDFLKNLGKMGVASITIPEALKYLDIIDDDLYADLKNLKEVDGYEIIAEDLTIQCFVCPLNCVLPNGKTCFCLTRKNHDGVLYSHAFNNPCIVRFDNIEKLPMYHFMPEKNTLSIATGGCNMRCLYCQNWHQSQSKPEDLRTYKFPKEKAGKAVIKKKIPIIAYTYTEPVSFLEYAVSIAEHTKPKGVKNVAASALFINEKPLKNFCKVLDGVSVALKGFSEIFYSKVCGQPLRPVLKAIEAAKSTGIWMEIITLIIPTYNDSDKEIKKMCKWILKNLGPDVPIHFGRFIPQYKLKNLPPTPIPTLDRIRNTALEVGLNYVYLFNVAPHNGNNTYCPSCKKKLIERLGFRVLKNLMKNGRCPYCGKKIPGVWS